MQLQVLATKNPAMDTQDSMLAIAVLIAAIEVAESVITNCVKHGEVFQVFIIKMS